MSDAKRTIEEAIEAFDDDALFKQMLHQLVTTFPPFTGAPKRIRDARDRLMRLVGAAPDLLDALFDLLQAGGMDNAGEYARASKKARAAIAKARGEP